MNQTDSPDRFRARHGFAAAGLLAICLFAARDSLAQGTPPTESAAQGPTPAESLAQGTPAADAGTAQAMPFDDVAGPSESGDSEDKSDDERAVETAVTSEVDDAAWSSRPK